MARVARVAEVRSEDLIIELLSVQGWDTRRPPHGDLLRQHEYKDYPSLRDALKNSSKQRAGGAGVPECILVDRITFEPLAVFEAKASVKDLGHAIKDVEIYGDALRKERFSPLLVAVAGTKDERFDIRVRKWDNSKWRDITYEGHPIGWIPDRDQLGRLRVSNSFDLRPQVPSREVLQEKADEINRLLRESAIKDELRPGVVAAIMLGLWKSKGDIRRDSKFILGDINSACSEAFLTAGKAELARSLRVDPQNQKLAVRVRRICDILERLSITTLTAETDYLGTLYEEFFRYTGGNTVGQYFTPRHIARMMADLSESTKKDTVLDPACGTGGFLIAAMQRLQRESHMSRADIIKIVKRQLIGFEAEPMTAALCVTNMILRGDGSTSIKKEDCFTASDYPIEKADVVLMNPPFPHKKTDRPSTDFIDRGLEGLKTRGILISIVPYSLLVNCGEWHRDLLAKHSLTFVCTLPFDLFQPYARYDTAIISIQKGVPHGNKAVFAARLFNDGFKIKKRTRVEREGSQIPLLLDAFKRKGAVPGLSAYPEISSLSKEWSPEAYIQGEPRSDSDFIVGFEESIRKHAAFYIQFGYRLVRGENRTPQRERSLFEHESHISLHQQEMSAFRIADYFDVTLGGKDEIEDLEEGSVPFVSTSEFFNGINQWRESNITYSAPVITVATDGSIASSFVQEFPFYAFYKVAILRPKKNISVSTDALYFIAYLINRERWRYIYARKLGKGRLLETQLYAPSKNGKPDFDKMAEITRAAVAFPIIKDFRDAFSKMQAADDSRDADVARKHLAEIDGDPSKLIQGEELKKRLAGIGS